MQLGQSRLLARFQKLETTGARVYDGSVVLVVARVLGLERGGGGLRLSLGEVLNALKCVILFAIF